MNFNVYVPKELGIKLKKAIKELHCSRNSIITEALQEWLGRHLPVQWPKGFFDFSPIEDVPDFKALRSNLSDTDEDPLE